MIELKNGDVEKINRVLTYICKYSLDDLKTESCVSIDPMEEYPRIKQIILNHDAAGKNNYDGYLQRNGKTKDLLNSNFFGELYQRQEIVKERQVLADKERKINIRNAKWAFPLSIIATFVALATLLLSIWGVI